MKNMKFLLPMAAIFACGTLQAQTETSRTTTTTTETTTLPDWGVVGSEKAHYYYIPDIDSYYDIGAHTFIYNNNGEWVKSQDVPAAYKDVDLYDSYKVVLNDDTDPFANYDKMKVKYKKGYQGEPQKTVKIKKRKDGTVKIKEK